MRSRVIFDVSHQVAIREFGAPLGGGLLGNRRTASAHFSLRGDDLPAAVEHVRRRGRLLRTETRAQFNRTDLFLIVNGPKIRRCIWQRPHPLAAGGLRIQYGGRCRAVRADALRTATAHELSARRRVCAGLPAAGLLSTERPPHEAYCRRAVDTQKNRGS